jgi:hypothetical protein
MTKRRRSDEEATKQKQVDSGTRFRRFAPKNPAPGTAATIGILAIPRYTYFMNAAAHDGNAEWLRTANRCEERLVARRSFQPRSRIHRASSQKPSNEPYKVSASRKAPAAFRLSTPESSAAQPAGESHAVA